MNRFDSIKKPLMWFMAMSLVALVAGCGGGGGEPVKPAPTSPGAGTGAGTGGHGAVPIDLLSILTNNFVILTKSGITNVPTSAITGNIGSSPITAASMNNVSCTEITGIIYGVDATYTGAATCFQGTAPDKTLVDNAVLDMGTAYTEATAKTADFTEIGAGNISVSNSVQYFPLISVQSFPLFRFPESYFYDA